MEGKTRLQPPVTILTWVPVGATLAAWITWVVTHGIALNESTAPAPGTAQTFFWTDYAASFAFLGVCDIILAFAGVTAGHWFAIHALANFVITYLTAPAVWSIFSRPQHAVYQPISAPDLDWSNAALIGSLHLYHLLRYSKLSAADVFHHCAFIPFNQLAVHWPSLSSSWTAWDRKWGPIVNAQHFFVCGLPGGLDYAMLALLKEGYINKRQHKHYQAKINVWLRSPGILATVVIHFFELMRVFGDVRTPTSAKVIGIFDALLIGFNALYYMERVVSATAAHRVLTRDPTTGKEEELEPICCTSGRPIITVSRKNIFAPLQVEWDETKPIKVS